MKDECGVELRVGQVVHVLMDSIFHAQIVDIRELPTMAGPNRMTPPQVILQIVLPLVADERGTVPVYIVRQAEEKPNKVLIQ